jgi:hypothetical protein
MQLFFRIKPIYEIAVKTPQQHFEGKIPEFWSCKKDKK